MEDIGVETVDAIRKRMGVDAEWSADRPRGFKWWGWNTSQEVWAEQPFEENEFTVSRLHARSDLLRGFDGSEKHLAVLRLLGSSLTMSGLVKTYFSMSRKTRIEGTSNVSSFLIERTWSCPVLHTCERKRWKRPPEASE